VELKYNTDHKIAAYLLAYYPNSVAMSVWVHLRLRRFYTANPSAVVLCGGPLPELLGLAVVLSGERRARNLRVTAVDRHAGDWAWALDVTLDLCSRFASLIRIENSVKTIDLERPWDEVPRDLRGADVYVLQNCLNEIWHARGAVHNLRSLAKQAEKGTLFVAVDQANYDGNVEAMRDLRDEFVRQGFSVVEDCDQAYEPLRTTFTMPLPVADEFFDGAPQKDEWGNWLGEYARRNVAVRSLVLRKENDGGSGFDDIEDLWPL
jgi:hypothetical protein